MKSSFYTPIVVMSVCLLATLSVSYLLWHDQKKRSDSAFETTTEDNMNALLERMADYRLALDSASSMIRSAGWLDREDWREYVAGLNTPKTLPGINGLGLIVPVDKADLPDFVADIAASGEPDFAVKPETDQPISFVIRYIEPIAPNLEAVGLDIAFETGRREAAIRARETRTAQLTPRILLVQDDTQQPGFLLLNPIYAVDDQFIGWSYAPFVGSKTLSKLSPAQTKQFWLTVYDGPVVDQETLIYDEKPPGMNSPRFKQTQVVSLMGRDWLLEWHSTPRFEASQSKAAHWIAFGFGLAITFLLGLLTSNLQRKEAYVRKQVELKSRELAAREKQTRSIVENAMLAILLLDDHDHIIAANRATGEMFDVDEHSLIGEALPIAWGLCDLPRTGRAGLIEAHTQDGRRLYLETRISGWTDETGSQRTVVMIQDVTKRENSASMLRANEARWNAALVGAEIGVFDIDLTTGKSIVSETWKRLMGVNKDNENDLQRHFLDRIHPDDLDTLKKADEACIRGENPRSVAQYRVRFGQDEWRWMRSDAFVAERDSTGKALRLLGSQTDVTDLVHAQKELEQSEKRFRAVLESAPVGMAMCAPDGHFVGTNTALYDLSGYDETELNTLKLQDLFAPEDFRDLVPAARSLSPGGTNALKREYRLVTKSGDVRWCLVSVAWSSAADRGEDVFIVQMQDISELKNVDKIKAQFVSTVSHELRTPLTSIKGALALLGGQFGETLPDAGKRLLTIAEQNGNRLVELVNDILDLEKISAGEIEFVYRPEDVSALVSQTIEELEPFTSEHGVTVKTHLPSIAPIAHVDPGRFQQVISNLLSNAAKFSDDDSIIDVSVTREEGRIRVNVENTGAGIPEAFRKRVFQPFQQADSSDTRKTGGTGLGLNICKQIIERMGGEIGFESDIGQRTRFFVLINETNEDVADTVVSLRPITADNTPARILHLEDDSDFAEILRKSFGDAAEITSVMTLEHAHQMVRQNTYDLIIIDWELPDGDGIELLSTISAHHAVVPVFGLSASEGKSDEKMVVLDAVKSRADLSDIVEKALIAVDAMRQAKATQKIA